MKFLRLCLILFVTFLLKVEATAVEIPLKKVSIRPYH